jgi:aldose 1-epimerase
MRYEKDGIVINSFTIVSEQLEATFIDLGATLTHLKVGDRDIVLGFDDPLEYLHPDNPYFGAVIGRTCNRTDQGKFNLDGILYQLPINNGRNSLHGGTKGLDKLLWNCTNQTECAIVFTTVSPHMDQGYPGTVNFKVEYKLVGLCLEINLEAILVGDADRTIVNLTCHPYFNLGGRDTADIKKHILIAPNLTSALKIDESQIPTGDILTAENAPCLFFMQPDLIGNRLGDGFLANTRGIDHFYLSQNPAFCRVEYDGLCLSVKSDAIGLQIYTGGWVNVKGKRLYNEYAGICLEPSAPPNAINSRYRPHVIIQKGKRWQQKIEYEVTAL